MTHGVSRTLFHRGRDISVVSRIAWGFHSVLFFMEIAKVVSREHNRLWVITSICEGALVSQQSRTSITAINSAWWQMKSKQTLGTRRFLLASTKGCLGMEGGGVTAVRYPGIFVLRTLGNSFLTYLWINSQQGYTIPKGTFKRIQAKGSQPRVHVQTNPDNARYLLYTNLASVLSIKNEIEKWVLTWETKANHENLSMCWKSMQDEKKKKTWRWSIFWSMDDGRVFICPEVRKEKKIRVFRESFFFMNEV